MDLLLLLEDPRYCDQEGRHATDRGGGTRRISLPVLEDELINWYFLLKQKRISTPPVQVFAKEYSWPVKTPLMPYMYSHLLSAAKYCNWVVINLGYGDE